MEALQLSLAIKQEARRLGFDLCRIVPIGEAPHADFFEKWVGLGSAGEMHYLERNIEQRRNPTLRASSTAEPLHSMIVLAVNYYQFALPPEIANDPSRGLIASYAWGDDYHDLIKPLLYELDAFIAGESGRTSHGKCTVDTGPVLERDWAHLAGIGFTGKNTCTINPELGSWLFLATILVPEQIHYDALQTTRTPLAKASAVAQGLPDKTHFGTWQIPLIDATNGETAPGTCGQCTRCLSACPTDAFVGPYHLDPRKCISYWTNETQSPIPVELRPLFQNKIYGCDVCQTICPFDRKLASRTPLISGLLAQSDRIAPYLLDGFHKSHPYWLSEKAFSDHFRKSPIKRAKRSGMLRNVCVALGNWASQETIEPLITALNDKFPIVRGHAAWGLGQILRKGSNEEVYLALQTRQDQEEDETVRQEIATALFNN